MKQIIYKKKTNLEKRLKTFSVIQEMDEKESITKIKKSFSYHIVAAENSQPVTEEPEVSIKKQFDSEKQIEQFSFRVKGYFYMTHNRMFIKVYFRHNLNIRIVWKTKVFSPKKSEILT